MVMQVRDGQRLFFFCYVLVGVFTFQLGSAAASAELQAGREE